MAAIVRFPRLPVFFKLGQLVHHAEFGTGTITSIRGCNVTVPFCDGERELDVNQVVTFVQAEEGWQGCVFHGANHRLEEGRWLWIVRSLSRCSHRGDWTAFLNKWGIPRSSAHDLIDRFLQERFWESLHSSGNRTEPNTNSPATDNAAVLDAKRRDRVQAELDRRETDRNEHGEEDVYWTIRIKLPEDVAEDCRERYKEADAAAKRYWVRTAYRFVDREDELKATD